MGPFTRQNQTNSAYTARLETQLAELRAEMRSFATTRQQQSWAQNVLTSAADAVKDVAQNVGSFVTLTGCGVAVGAGVERFGFVGATDHGLGAGLILGGASVGVRVALDTVVGELFGLLPQKEEVERQEQVHQVFDVEPDPALPQPDMGLEVWDGHGSYIKLLPELPRHLVLRMAKITAGEYFGNSDEKNFSERQTGRPWGEHLKAVKKSLLAIGHIESAGNNTHQFTERGEDWLRTVIKQR